MFENLGIQSLMNVAEKTATDPNKLEVVVVGLGTVFAGLISIVIICKIVGLFCGAAKKEKKAKEAAPAAPAVSAPIENRGEIVAAVCAAVAEELGTDVSALRVRSFKKL